MLVNTPALLTDVRLDTKATKLVSKKEKEEVIVLFLAVLHMLANRLADVEQGDAFGDILVTPTDTAEVISQ